MTFCQKCGASVREGNRFCTECGRVMPAEVPVDHRAAVPPAAAQTGIKKEKKGFFSSPAGIALVVIIGVAVVAGIALGAFFLLRNSDGKVDAETVGVWDEYESLLEENSEGVPAITLDQAALQKTQADLEETRKKVAALEKTLEKTGGTEARRSGNDTNSIRDVKADQLAEALAAYNAYVQKMKELFAALVGANLLDQNVINNLNAILADLQKLGANVTVTANKFLDGNAQVVTVKVDPPVAKFAEKFQADLQARVNAAVQAEQQRLAGEQAAAAAQAAELERQKAAAEAAQLVTCPLCGGVGTIEGGDGRYICPFCGGSGVVTRAKAAQFDPADWIP
ncbi:MAG: zinc-ribbon domain-containing protein [Actinobacteria bacterium]|nr:zinc-ribbon domain-containing protein [Actinomycetota bacterium]MBU1944126.1 zinc-ribbon domain-containing protein [Actinomycetota bacterium]MBU2686725.1 zinc-ribbon domain-containing protein [Actinomycetota bacterium]